MGINLTNFLTSKSKNTRMMDFQDLDHIDGLSISALSADLYKTKRDDLVMFYFRDGANHASVYTKSKIISENIKWNLSKKAKKIYSLIVNTRNANAFTGKQGYESLKKIADLTSEQLSKKQVEDEDYPKKYNQLMNINDKIGHEKLYRKDHKYDLFIPIKFNFDKRILGRGSCIFIHLTEDYKPTAGCVALKKKDFYIMLKLINKNTRIKIF